MGTDIRLYVEAYNKTKQQWESTEEWAEEYGELCVPYSKRIYKNRNYRLFAMLAGERNDNEITPFAEPRGLPENVDKRIAAQMDGYHDRASYFTLGELLSFDWTTPMITKALVRLKDWHHWKERLEFDHYCEPHSCCMGTNSTIINEEDARELIASFKRANTDSRELGKRLESDYWRTYVRCEWTRPKYVYADDFLGRVIPYMLSLGGHNHVRIVFMFG